MTARAACFVLLALAHCSSSSGPTDAGTNDAAAEAAPSDAGVICIPAGQICLGQATPCCAASFCPPSGLCP